MRRAVLAIVVLTHVIAARANAQSNASGKIPITTKSDAVRSLFLQGRVANEALHPVDAYALFEQAVARDPEFAMGEYSLASTAPTARLVAQHLQRALALAPHASVGERLLILNLQARTNADPVHVRQYADSLVVLYPRDERAHWVLGNALFAQQKFDLAVAEYQKAIDINPDYSLAYNSLGYAYRPTGNLAAAETAFRRYILLVPNDPNPYDSYAELLMKEGRFDESIAQYRKALAIDPHFGGSYVGIAANQMFAKRHAESVAEAELYYSHARSDLERRTALLTEAITDVDMGATDKALQAMERRYDIAHASNDTVNMSADDLAIADVLLDAGRIDAARNRYNQGHNLITASGLPADAKADNELARHHDLARIALAQHDIRTAQAEAAAYMTGATTRQNDVRTRDAHGLMGLVALEQKLYDESASHLGAADQQDPAVLYALSRAYRGRGDAAKAAALQKTAIENYILPTMPYAFIRAKAASPDAALPAGATGSEPSRIPRETQR